MNALINLKPILDSIIYSVIGIIILVISFVIIEKITPENVYKKVVHEGNTALAIVFASFIIAMAIIISSAIHG